MSHINDAGLPLGLLGRTISAMAVDPGLFAISPTVPIAVEDESGNIRTFYIHKSLLAQQSKGFAYHLRDQHAGKVPDEPSLTVKSISHPAFTDFVCWLYGHLSPDSSMLARLPALRTFAINWTIPEFDKYLLCWCHEHCGPGDLLELLRKLAQGRVSPEERLPDYALAKLAYEIASKGWLNLITVAGENWQQFMSTPDTRFNDKSKYVARLMSKLVVAERLNSQQQLVDPATSIHTWFPTESED